MIGAAVVFFVFNRPEQTRRSFAAIRNARPPRLFVVADGPRTSRAADAGLCEQVRAIVRQVDWPCTVERLYAEANLGCTARITSGLKWVFARTDRAIILEDDCLPHPDFFTFCDALLDRYADNEQVWHITGGQYCERPGAFPASYYFSKYAHAWGWATWARAWQHFDANISFWPDFVASDEWRALMPDDTERAYWTRVMRRVHSTRLPAAWDYAWIATVWRYGRLVAAPYRNLVDNIGFGPDATQTAGQADISGPPARTLGALVHPNTIERDVAADHADFYESSRGRALQRERTVSGAASAAARRMIRLLTLPRSR